jgi:hypothetical protein
MRSIDVPGGRGPMSARNCGNESHSGQAVIPRPPYKSKSVARELPHRVFIAFHERYSGVRFPAAWPCVRFFVCIRSRRKQPHDLVPRGDRREVLSTCFIFPQSHKTAQIAAPCLFRPARPVTISRPKICPITESTTTRRRLPFAARGVLQTRRVCVRGSPLVQFPPRQ